MLQLQVLAAVLGLVVGSFLTVCVHRIPLGQSMSRPRSRCPECGRTLGPADLIPVISYTLMGGRCRSCRTPVSPMYPAVELATALLFVGAVTRHGISALAISTAVLGSIAIVAAVIDLRTRTIPNVLVIAGTVLGLILLPFVPDPLSRISAAFAASGFLLAVAIVSRGGMGAGDVKLAFVIGLLLGLRLVLVAMFAAFISGALAGVILIVLRRKSRKDLIPFGPFLAIGAFAAMFFGDAIIRWYFG